MPTFLIHIAILTGSITLLALYFGWRPWKKKAVPSDPNRLERECKGKYDILKGAILECNSLHVLSTIERDTEDFFMTYHSRVEHMGLTTYYRDLCVEILRKKNKLKDENSYA